MSKPHDSQGAGGCGHQRPSAEQRRMFLGTSIVAGLLGGLLGVIPAIPGIGLFLDPILRRVKKKEGEGGDNLIRVGSVDALPLDGTPVQVPVIADLTDVWNREANQPVGSVFLRRLPDGAVACLNTICPHAGCMVSYAADRRVFQCPCHTSSFELDGKQIMPSPSPRAMDPMEVKVEQGDIKIKYVNYLPGKADQVAK